MTIKPIPQRRQHKGAVLRITAPTAIVLDTSPLGLLTQRPNHVGGETCCTWYAGLIQIGCHFFVPEIADFELRRELLRHANTNAITRLDVFNAAIPERYLPLTTPHVHLAAALWAQARNQGKTTAPPDALDGDTLIAAQANLLNPAAFGLSATVVATANFGHLSALTTAALWNDITR